MPDIRVPLDTNTHGCLRALAFSRGLTLKQLVINLLTQAAIPEKEKP
jgi:hypothetical protein